MLQVTHDELSELIKQYYKTKIALIVRGRFGIGKSDVIKQVSKEIAVENKREFVLWNRLTDKEKAEVFNNSEKYFVLIDIRLSEYDASDIKGLPVFKDDKKSIEFKVPYWALLLENDKSDGILFFDEINLAPPLVMSSCYKIIYDRIVNEGRINNNWLIMGAGNLDEDRAYTQEIAPPLRDRCGEVELIGANIDTWNNWAINNNISSRVIGFLNFKNGSLYKVDFNDNQKFTTYRGWERVSKLTKEISDYKKLGLIAGSAIGEGIAKEFVAFCKISEEINLNEIIAKPEKIKKIEEISVKWFINTAIAEQYRDKKVKFEKVMDISKVLDSIDNVELVAYLWKMCAGYDKNFKKEFVKKVDDKLVSKYSKYLI